VDETEASKVLSLPAGRVEFERGTLAKMTEVARILFAIDQGDAHAAEKRMPLVHDELRKTGGAEAGTRKARPDAPGAIFSPPRRRPSGEFSSPGLGPESA
jgi:hypothetical protein